MDDGGSVAGLSQSLLYVIFQRLLLVLGHTLTSDSHLTKHNPNELPLPWFALPLPGHRVAESISLDLGLEHLVKDSDSMLPCSSPLTGTSGTTVHTRTPRVKRTAEGQPQ